MRLFIFLFITATLITQRTDYYRSYTIDLRTFTFIPKEKLINPERSGRSYNKFTYNEKRIIRINGYISGLEYYDTREGVNHIVFEYLNKNENDFKLFYLDKNKKPKQNIENAVYGKNVTYHENTYTINHLDSGGKLISDRYNVAKEVYVYNKSENTVLTKFFDLKGSAVKNRDDVYQIKRFYDQSGNIVRVEYLNLDGQLSLNSNRFAIQVFKFKQNVEVERHYLDANGVEAASLPYGVSKEIKNKDRKNFYKQWLQYKPSGEEVETIGVLGNKFSVIQEAKKNINFNHIEELTTEDLIDNFRFSLFHYNSDRNSAEKEIKKLFSDYTQKMLKRANNLQKEKIIFNDRIRFYKFHSSNSTMRSFAESISVVTIDSAEQIIRNTYGLNDEEINEASLSKITVASRMLNGYFKTGELIYFKWKDVLFCINPFYETPWRNVHTKYRDLVEIDFGKLPITEDINYVYFEGLNIKSYAQNDYYKDIKYVFNNCRVDGSIRSIRNFLNKPINISGNDVDMYKKTTSWFYKSDIDVLKPYFIDGSSNIPYRYFSSDQFVFKECSINELTLWANLNDYFRLKKERRKDFSFYNSKINSLTVNGDLYNLEFFNTSVDQFKSTFLTDVYGKITIENSSFESPLNFSNLSLKEKARLSFKNSSYQSYLKIPWEKIEGKIHIESDSNRLNHYASFYNLLSESYKYLSFIDDADKSYFYWKEFERKNYWDFFWNEKDNHWYNPMDVIEAIGYTLFNNVNYYSCGYGVKPLWIFPFTAFIVGLFALIYFLMPTRISNLEDHLMAKNRIITHLRRFETENLKQIFGEDDFDFKKPKMGLIEDITSSISTDELLDKLSLIPKSRYNLTFFWHCIYFSFSTFTTIGIGDWYPTGKLNKALVMIEGALGWLCLGLFITTYANILLR